MPVKIQGEHTFDAPREVVWKALLDPEVLARTLPGAEKLEMVGENQLAGALDMRIGPVQGKFQGTVTMTDVRPLEGYHLTIKGTGAGRLRRGRRGDPARRRVAGGGTVLHYEVDAQVGGRIAGVGQRLLDSSAKVVTRQALEGLDRQIAFLSSSAAVAAGPSAVPATAPVPPGLIRGGGRRRAFGRPRARRSRGSAGAGRIARLPPPPSQAKFAADFAKGLAGELIPPERRPLAAAIAVAVVALLVWLFVRACGG